jgi:catechol 2,3-dioxygenase-like lactoylglutathione lyase family enzyme
MDLLVHLLSGEVNDDLGASCAGSIQKEEVELMIKKIDATVLFVRDLAQCTTFYRDTLGLQPNFSDEVSVTFPMEGRYLLLLAVSSAASLVQMDVSTFSVAGGPRVLLAAGVEDVDATYEELLARGVTFLRPPTDQPWGLRTAHFADPEGNLWEINQSIE